MSVKGLPPGPGSAFLQTIRLARSKDLLRDVMELARKYGDPMTLPTTGAPIVMSGGPRPSRRSSPPTRTRSCRRRTTRSPRSSARGRSSCSVGLGPWARFRRKHGALREMLFQETARARASSEGREDVLSLLVRARDEEGGALGDQEIFEQLLTMLFAGHETTAVSLAWALYLLHTNVEVRERLAGELLSLGPDADPSSLAKLPYLEAVCLETLRRYPVLAVLMRKLARPFTLLGGGAMTSPLCGRTGCDVVRSSNMHIPAIRRFPFMPFRAAVLAACAAGLAACAEPIPPAPPGRESALPTATGAMAASGSSIQVAADPPDAGADAAPDASGSTVVATAPPTLKELLLRAPAMPLLRALTVDRRTHALVKAPAGVDEKVWNVSLLSSLRDWVAARGDDKVWSRQQGVTFSGAALAALVDATLAWLSALPEGERESLRKKLAAGTTVTLPVTRKLTQEGTCGAGQSVCGYGPHSACCSPGQKCCAGGAAGNYYCHNGSGMCPPLP